MKLDILLVQPYLYLPEIANFFNTSFEICNYFLSGLLQMLPEKAWVKLFIIVYANQEASELTSSLIQSKKASIYSV